MTILLVFSIGFFLVSSVALLPVKGVPGKKSKSNERDTVTLSQGQSLRLEFQSRQPAPISEVSLKLKTIDTSDPFASYQVPLTIQVYEKNRSIGSESFTSDLGTGFKKIHVDVNNDL